MSNENEFITRNVDGNGNYMSIGILRALAVNRLTMYDTTQFPRIAGLCETHIGNVIKSAERHHRVLQIIQDQAKEIFRLKAEIQGMKIAESQGVGPNCNRQPWDMTTPEFMACLKLEWQDPFADEAVGFGTPEPDSPLCTLENFALRK
jgi:hypothetical protein